MSTNRPEAGEERATQQSPWAQSEGSLAQRLREITAAARHKAEAERTRREQEARREAQEIIATIEKTCKQVAITKTKSHHQVHEIDFKNKLGQMVGSEEKKGENQAPLKLETPWVAVDSTEKSLLSKQEIQRGPIANWIWGPKKK